jgi:cobalt-zinc-cadmium efflux system outer membrane protein
MQTRFNMLGAAVLSLPLLSAAAQPSEHRSFASDAHSVASTMSTNAPVVTLEEAINRALAANPTLRSTMASIGIADAAKLQAGLLVNPELSVLREGMDRENRTQTVQIAQRIELGGKRSARVDVAERERQVALQDVAVAAAQLRAEVTTAYFEALTAEERLELARASLEVAEKATLAATKRVAAGRISPVEQSRSRVAEAGVRLELAQALSDAGLAKQRLAALWGETNAVQVSLERPDGDATALPPLAALRQKLEAGPHLGRAYEQLEREEAQVRLERAQRMPDLTVTLGSRRDSQIGVTQAVVGLSVPLPLFNRNQGNVLAALRRTDKARSDLDAERLRVTQALSEAYQRAELARQEVASIRTEILPVAQSTYEAAVTGFEAGKFSFFDVLDAQRTLFQARAQYLRAMSDRYRSVADLGRYVQLRPDQSK